MNEQQDRWVEEDRVDKCGLEDVFQKLLSEMGQYFREKTVMKPRNFREDTM